MLLLLPLHRQTIVAAHAAIAHNLQVVDGHVAAAAMVFAAAVVAAALL